MITSILVNKVGGIYTMINEKEARPFIPGIFINLTDCCNFSCQYCPPYGENLCKSLKRYDEKAVLTVINLAKKYKIKQIRFTGGEPLLEPKRLQVFLEACGDSFERLVLNTNGSLLEENFHWLENYKKQIILKISLDTLDENHFNVLTHTGDFQKVLKNLKLAILEQFNIEVNAVLYNQNFEEMRDLIEFSIENKINLKFLTTSTFYGNVAFESLNIDVNKLIDYLKDRSENISSERLIGERGAPMLVFRIDKSKITIFDSFVKNSLTPFKCYFACCETQCYQYPCNYGAFSIGISTDGIMSICRGRKDFGEKIFFNLPNEIEKIFVRQLEQFQSCFSINVNII